MAVIYDMAHIDAMEGHEFEHFIANLLRKLGYENVEVTRGSGDQGVDVLAEKDGVRYAIQCKCYSSDLGNTPVQEVNTGKTIYHCHVGVVVTNRYFTQGAKDAAKATGTLLWDRNRLQQMVAQVQGISSTEPPAHQGNDSFTLWSSNPLLQRGGIALEDKEWKKAQQFFERVLNTNPENAEAYLGLVMAEAELSEMDFVRVYVKNRFQLNQNNLRHAEKFAGRGLAAWFRNLETRWKDAEARQKQEETKRLTKGQERNKEYKGVILDYLFANPELVVTTDKMYDVLRDTYPAVLWSSMKVESLLDVLEKDGILIRVREREYKRICGRLYNVPAAFMLSEAERFRLKAQEDIVDYLFANSELAVTTHDIIEKVLIPTYPNEQWSDKSVGSLLNALCGKGGKLTHGKGKTFMITKAECRRREKERTKERAELETEQAKLQTELANLKGLFTGGRRRKIEARLAEIKNNLYNV